MRLNSGPRGAGAVTSLFVTLLLLSAAPAASAESTPAPRAAVRTLDGTVLELADLYRRGPVLLDFWATWCKPCLQSLPEIRQLHDRYAARGLSVIGISIDGPRNFARVRPFVTRLKLEYPVALDDDGSLQRDFRVTAIPTAVLIDTTGTIRWVRSGYRPGEGRELGAAILALLGAPADTTE